MPQPSEIEIVDVTQAAVDERLRGRSIDQPKPGTRALQHQFVGWALARNGRLASIELVGSTGVIETVELNRRRPDVAEAFPDVPGAELGGFSVLVHAGRLEGTETVTVRALLDDGEHVELGEVKLRGAGTSWQPTSQRPSLRSVTPQAPSEPASQPEVPPPWRSIPREPLSEKRGRLRWRP